MCDDNLTPWKVGVGPPETNELFKEFLQRYVPLDFQKRFFSDMGRKPIRDRYFLRLLDVPRNFLIGPKIGTKKAVHGYVLIRDHDKLEVEGIEVIDRTKLGDILFRDIDSILLLVEGELWQCYFRMATDSAFLKLYEKGAQRIPIR